MADFLKQYYNNYFLGSLDRTLACLRKNVEAGTLKPTVAVQILKRGLKQDRCLKMTKDEARATAADFRNELREKGYGKSNKRNNQ